MTFIYLMRETLEDDETLEQAVSRGVKEEFGVEGKLEKYIGTVIHQVSSPTVTFEKNNHLSLLQGRVAR